MYLRADEAAAAVAQLADAGVVQAMANLAVAAGSEIARLTKLGFETRTKSDSSPVTICDESAEKVILAGLDELWVGSRMAGVTRAAKAETDPGAPAPLFESMQDIHARPRPAGGLIALVSRSHSSPQVEAFLSGLAIAERRDMGSSLKYCLLAEGVADVYPRLSPTMEWDTAAGDAVLRAAGGATFDEAGGDLRYGKSDDNFRNPNFISWGAPEA